MPRIKMLPSLHIFKPYIHALAIEPSNCVIDDERTGSVLAVIVVTVIVMVMLLRRGRC